MSKNGLIILTLLLAACATPTPVPTPTLAPTATHTITVVTSVPTITPTSIPTATATLVPTLSPSATPTLAIPVLITRDANAFSRDVKVPILMYHYIEPIPANNKDQLRADLTVTPEHLEAQLKFLKDRGYTAIDMYQLYDALARGAALPPKPIVFTFDDGYADMHEYAFPLMKKYGFTGTIFIITDFTETNRKEYLTWDQALDMARAGWRLESHSKTHPSLEGQSLEFQRDQIRGSMETLKKHLGYTPRFFAYPYGKYDSRSIQELNEAGYWSAVTTNIGNYHRLGSAFALPRVRVNGYTLLPAFAQSLGEKAP